MFPELFVGKRPRLSGNFFGLFQAVAPEFHYAGTVGVFKNFKPQSQLIGYGRHGQRFPVAVQDGAARRRESAKPWSWRKGACWCALPARRPAVPRRGKESGTGNPSHSVPFPFPRGHLRSGGHAFPVLRRPYRNPFSCLPGQPFPQRHPLRAAPPQPGQQPLPPEKTDACPVEAWPQAVSAVHAANPANNTRERIRTFIFISLQECGKIYRKESTIIRAHAYS